MDPTMKQRKIIRSKTAGPQQGFTLIEAAIAGVVLMVGLLAMLAVFAQAVAVTQTAQQDQIARQQAISALESIFTARDTQQVTFDQIANQPTGIFQLGPQQLTDPGLDGLTGTADDGATVPTGCPTYVQCMKLPGPDGVLGTPDDVTTSLTNYTRTITIANVLNADGSINPNLKSIAVNVTYVGGGLKAGSRTYTVTGLISAFR